MLFDSYCKLIHSLEGAKHVSHIQDFSVPVCSAKEELSLAAQELESGQVALSPEGDTGITTPEAAVVTLTNHLGRRDVRRALRLLHVYRSMWSGELFGSSEEDDQDVLLALLCKQIADGRSGVLVISRSGQELQTACHKLMGINAQLKKSIKVIENMETKEEVEEKSEMEKAEGEGGPVKGDEKVKLRRKGNRKGKNDGRKGWKSEGDRNTKEGSGEKGGRGTDEKKKGKDERKGKEDKKKSSKESTPEPGLPEDKKQREDADNGKVKDGGEGGEGEDTVVVVVTCDEVGGGEGETKEAKIVFQSNECVENGGDEGREVTLDTKESSENKEEVKIEDVTLEDATGSKVDGDVVVGSGDTRMIDEEEVESDLTALIEAIEEIEEEIGNKDKMEALPLKLADEDNTSTGATGVGVEPSPAKGENFAPLPDMDSGFMAETPDSQASENKASFSDDVPLDIQVTPAEEDKLFPPDKEPLRKESTGEAENEVERKALGIKEDVWQKDPNSRPTSGESLCTEL